MKVERQAGPEGGERGSCPQPEPVASAEVPLLTLASKEPQRPTASALCDLLQLCPPGPCLLPAGSSCLPFTAKCGLSTFPCLLPAFVPGHPSPGRLARQREEGAPKAEGRALRSGRSPAGHTSWIAAATRGVSSPSNLSFSSSSGLSPSHFSLIIKTSSSCWLSAYPAA